MKNNNIPIDIEAKLHTVMGSMIFVACTTTDFPLSGIMGRLYREAKANDGESSQSYDKGNFGVLNPFAISGTMKCNINIRNLNSKWNMMVRFTLEISLCSVYFNGRGEHDGFMDRSIGFHCSIKEDGNGEIEKSFNG